MDEAPPKERTAGSRTSVRTLLRAGLTCAIAAYPVVVYLECGRSDPLWVALGLGGLLASRAWAGRDPAWLLAGVLATLLGATASLAGTCLPLKLYPAMASAVLLAVLGAGLVRPPTAIERAAPAREPAPCRAGAAYSRRVSIAWCGLFAANGLVSAATAVWGSEATWLLYNGLLAWLLVATFRAGERLLRRRLLAAHLPHAAASRWRGALR